MLDNLENISKIDKSGMLDTYEKFPDQISETIKILDSSELENLYKIDHIVISGMGASAISGDILQSLFRDRFEIPIFVTRKYDLPKWVNKNTLVLSQSYSGNTEETLSTFKHAFQKRCKIIGISSGGKLEEYCQKRDVSFIKIPSGYQPRAATAYILFSGLLALKKVGLLRADIDSEINETVDLVKKFRDENNKIIPEEKNISKQLAKNLFKKIPQVYGWGIYAPISRRWCQQFNENSKVIARYDEVSECNHNDIVGWSMNPDISKLFTCMVFRDEDNESIYMSKRLDFMKKLLDDVSAGVNEIHIKGKKRLAKMMYTMYLGDFTSCYLAILRNIDPTPVDVIMELKNDLSKI